MPFIKVKITKYINNDFPGFIECEFVDAYGEKRIIIDKVPVISKKEIDENSVFPIEELMAVEFIKKWTDKDGKLLTTINTGMPWGIESINGETIFDIFQDQIIDSEE